MVMRLFSVPNSIGLLVSLHDGHCVHRYKRRCLSFISMAILTDDGMEYPELMAQNKSDA